MEEKWMLAQRKADFNKLAKQLGVSPYLIRLMVNRGVKEEEMEGFLYGGLEGLHSPFLLKGMETAVKLLQAAKTDHTTDKCKIAVASDFDCDGIFAGMVLCEGLKELGLDVSIYTPDRVTEGYGLNRRIVEEAKGMGVSLLLTCDNGIAAIEPIRYAKSLGMTVIVTDHHEVPFEVLEDGGKTFILPEADAIVNPKQKDCEYPFKGICGATVAYKLIEALYEKEGVEESKKLSLLKYVAIATITDVMDLVDENRILVKYGLESLRNCDHIGLKAIMDVNGIGSGQINAYHIAFVLGPCFNAAGRLATVNMAYQLLNCKEWKKAVELANELKELNEKRKDMTEKGYKKACEIIEGGERKQDKVLLVPLKDCHESLAGIIAGRIREKYHKPSFVFVETEEGWKGSGRSIEAYNMFEELTSCRDLLIRYGGHPLAAGLLLKKGDLEILRKRLNEQTTLTDRDFIPVIHIDIDLPIHYISKGLIKELNKLEPYGKGNPKPVFAERRFTIPSARFIGKESNYLKMKVKNEKGNEIEALYFGEGREFVKRIREGYGERQAEKMLNGEPNQVGMALTYYPSVNEYNGYETMQIIIQNYRIVK